MICHESQRKAWNRSTDRCPRSAHQLLGNSERRAVLGKTATHPFPAGSPSIPRRRKARIGSDREAKRGSPAPSFTVFPAPASPPGQGNRQTLLDQQQRASVAALAQSRGHAPGPPPSPSTRRRGRSGEEHVRRPRSRAPRPRPRLRESEFSHPVEATTPSTSSPGLHAARRALSFLPRLVERVLPLRHATRHGHTRTPFNRAGRATGPASHPSTSSTTSLPARLRPRASARAL